MKRVSWTDEAIIRIEVILEPIEVQVPALAIEVEVSNVAPAIRILPDKRTRYHLNHRPLNALRAEYYLGHQSPPISRTKYLHF